MTYVIEKVEHLKQRTSNLCWATCAQMLYLHKARPAPGAVANPDDKKRNFGLEAFSKEAGLTCAGLTVRELSASVIEHLLRQHGPLIATVGWYSRNPHLADHAILIVGVDDENVYLDNPAMEKGQAKDRLSLPEFRKILGTWPCKLMYLK